MALLDQPDDLHPACDVARAGAERTARAMEEARKQGVCFHDVFTEVDEKMAVCVQCGSLFPSVEALIEDRQESLLEWS